MKKSLFLLIILGLYIGLVIFSSRQEPVQTSLNDTTKTGFLSYTEKSSAIIPNTIRNIDANFQPKDSKAFYEQLREISNQSDGIITQANITTIGDEYSGQIRIAIPDDKIGMFVNALNQLDAKVYSERSYTDDVAIQLAQLKSRIKSKSALEQNYLQILRNTKNVSEIIIVSDYLSRVRTELEDLNRQLNVYNRGASGVNFNISINTQPEVIVMNKSWSPWEDVKNAYNNLLVTLKNLLSLTIWWLVYLIPLSLISALVLIGYKRIRRRYSQ